MTEVDLSPVLLTAGVLVPIGCVMPDVGVDGGGRFERPAASASGSAAAGECAALL